MMQCGRLTLLLCLLSLHCVFGESGDGTNPIEPLEIFPSTCRAGPHIVLGTPFKWQLSTSGGVVDGGNCSFSTENSQNEFTLESSTSTISQPGVYSYQCPEMDLNGNITIVPAQYSIAVCDGCSNHSNEYAINPGEAIEWIYLRVVGEMSTEPFECSTQIWKDGEQIDSLGLSVRSYQFNTPGNYQMFCQEDTSMNTTIIVSDRSLSSQPESTAAHLIPLIYTHAALMAAAFGFLLPLGAFLAYNKSKLVHKITQPIGIALALIGFILVVVYVQLAQANHFRYLIHGVIGLALMLLVVIVMPLLLIQKSRTWHKKTGHVVAFFGMANVLLGLSILPAPHPAALIICIIYGLWLVVALSFYVIFPRTKKVSSYTISCANDNSKEAEELGFFKDNRSNSVSSMKGPQRLDKNIISEDKMIELRKKSMDFLEASRQRDQLNIEFKHHPLYNQPVSHHYDEEEEDDEDVQYDEARRGSKPDQDSPESEFDDLENSRVPLCLSSQRDTSLSPTPDVDMDTNDRVQMYVACSDEEHVQSTDDLDDSSVPSGGRVNRAQTFNHGPILRDQARTERGGSLRVTRHSTRAKRGVDDVFPECSSSSILSESTKPPAMVETSMSVPAHMASNPPPAGTNRRRKGAFIPPPIITTTPVDTIDSPEVGCPFHAGLSVNRNGSRGSTQSPRSIRRGISPTPSGDSVFELNGASPRPQRKKKVSVATIEATVVPPTPVNLLAPAGLPRSPSSNTLRAHHDVFTDNAFRSVMQISQDAIVCANSVGDIVFWSVGACKMFGYTPGEAIGSNLEMIVPLSFREKHRGGINKRTSNTLKYVRKHSYAPEEQKHARLYEVRALTKSGHEIPAEVHVTSFVIEGDLFYTGVITEMTRKTGGSIGSTSDINELSLKQRALAVGAQMKIAHNLMNANHITKKELERVLVSSLRATDFEVETFQTEQMVAGIMKEGDPDGSGVISFVNLIKLLSKHQLYISESGNIARYGKTTGAEGGNLSRGERSLSRLKEFLFSSASIISWIMIYLFVNVVMFVIGVLVTDKTGVQKFAYGSGPVLSLNCVIVLLPTLTSFITAMRNSHWMNKYMPLTKATLIHIIITIGILTWTTIHVLTHFVSFAVDKNNSTSSLSTSDRFKENLTTNVFPAITGLVVLVIFLAMGVSSVRPIRKLIRFIPFHIVHWICLILFYVLLVVHGVNYFNPSFWKWLLPLAILAVFERIYRYTAITRHSVKVKRAGRYDDQSRTAIIELERPSRFKFEPGQFILLNLPWIEHFKWQPCQISSGPKDQKLTIHVPFSNDAWASEAFNNLKKHPYHMPKSTNHKKDDKTKNRQEEVTIETTEANHPADLSDIQFTGPFGPTAHSKLLFDFKVSTLVCAGDSGPHCAKAVVKKFLEYRKSSSCHCGCTPVLSKLYFIWVVPSGNDFEWFTDYLSELCEDEHVHRYLDVRVFLTNINSPPDELASALLQLGLKTAGPQCIVRRPSQPQLNNLHSKTSYGVPDFNALLDYISAQNATIWNEKETDFGVFTVGSFHHSMKRDLTTACKNSSKVGQLLYKQHHIDT